MDDSGQIDTLNFLGVVRRVWEIKNFACQQIVPIILESEQRKLPVPCLAPNDFVTCKANDGRILYDTASVNLRADVALLQRQKPRA